ncbi:hypothetical protein SDC9_06284 [bioreactor metagenome]|uniref:Uncharacterized protein n=1 Tax=bioreactor metagenome TaxID=1076179 RepID=A0A644T1D5_9ZZZZ
MRHQAQHREDDDAGERNEDKRREHPRDVQPVSRLEDAEGQARADTAGARDIFRHHRPDQAQPAGDAQTAEEIGQRRRDLQIAQPLPAGGAIDPVQVAQVVVGRVQPERGVRQDREEGDDPGAEQEPRQPVVDIDEDQRRDRDDRGDLQDHCEGVKTHLGPAAETEEHRKPHAAHHRDRERHQRDLQRDAQCRQQDRRVLDQRLRNKAGPRQDVMRDLVPDDDAVPQHDQQHDGDARQKPAQHPLAPPGAGTRQLVGIDRGVACGKGGIGKAHAVSPIAAWSASEAVRHSAA